MTKELYETNKLFVFIYGKTFIDFYNPIISNSVSKRLVSWWSYGWHRQALSDITLNNY